MTHPVDSKRKGIEYLRLSLKGFCMGVADIIPGISGGTIAFILGIYEDLIEAIKSFDLRFFQLLCSFKIKPAAEQVAWRFLGFLLVGILTAVFSLSKILSWLLADYPVLVHSFFFGLILATIPIIAGHIKNWTIPMGLSILVAAFCSYALVGLIPVKTPDAFWFILISGAIAICAMILPGISGAFILLLLGKYKFIVEAVHQRDILILAVFAAGCVIGLLSFVRILSWVLKRYHNLTIAVLTGLVIGSLRKIWPWKSTGFEESVNVLPAQFNGEVAFALLLMAGGCLVAYLLNYTPSRKKY